MYTVQAANSRQGDGVGGMVGGWEGGVGWVQAGYEEERCIPGLNITERLL